MRRILLFLVCIGLCPMAAPAQNAHEIVAMADRVRNPSEPHRVVLSMTEYVGGKSRDQTTLVVFAKEQPSSGQFRNLVRYIEPPRDVGKLALLDGQNFWFYDPASKASVRISAQQRLIGQASIGDVLTVNLASDYTAKLLDEETISDADRQKRDCYHLDLRGANASAVYNRVEYWVEKGSFRPIRERFYADSGSVMKVLYYRGFAQRLGAMRPGEAVIIDAVDASLVTTARFDSVTAWDIPDMWYQRDFLPRVRAE